jgi:RHS repeat-associated protein
VNGQTYTYDSAGNVTDDGTRTNTWDYRNQLAQTVKASTTYRYLYDQGGQRTAYYDGSATTTYPNKYYDQKGNTSTKHIYAGSELVATIEGNGTATTTNTIHTDHLGGTNVVTNASGTLAQTLAYYPFGASRVDEQYGTTNERRKFTGHVYDDATALYYMNARYQNPNVGRFVSEDPVTWSLPIVVLLNPQKLNSYAYADNNPVNMADPTGQLAFVMAVPAFATVAEAVVDAFVATVAVFTATYVVGDYIDRNTLKEGTLADAGPRVSTPPPQDPNDLKTPRDNSPKWRNTLYFGLGLGYLGVEVYQQYKEHNDGIQKFESTNSLNKNNGGGCLNCAVSNHNQQSTNNKPSSNLTTSSSNNSSSSSISNPSSSSVNWNAVRTAVQLYYGGSGK